MEVPCSMLQLLATRYLSKHSLSALFCTRREKQNPNLVSRSLVHSPPAIGCVRVQTVVLLLEARVAYTRKFCRAAGLAD